jgi:starch phosphorylase
MKPSVPNPSGRDSDPRSGFDAASIRRDILNNLSTVQGKFPEVATMNDWYMALACTIRDRLFAVWTETVHDYYLRKARTVCYLSAEFLIGPQLGMNLLSLGLETQVREAVAGLGLNVDELLDQEQEPGLGNGGLGRVAACYMDSLASLRVPAIGYGIRYEFGIFDQTIRDGWQVEMADRWLRLGTPWEVSRPEIRFDIGFGGTTGFSTDETGQVRAQWIPESIVQGVPCDIPTLGYRVPTANFLRLWKAEATQSFDFGAFNVGDYYRAVNSKVASESLTKVLYPNDEPIQGRELRLKQQHFFVSCSLQDMIRIHRQRDASLDRFHEKFAIQLNDTHPALAIPELMRLLVDEHRIDWDRAWEISVRTFGYTNHTLLPEALERWPVALIRRVLPRHLEIIYEINRRFLDSVRMSFPGDEDMVRCASLVEETGERYIRMAHLASVGSHSINGVTELHTRLLKSDVLGAMHRIMPQKFNSKTNGISIRRFLQLANPGLADLVTRTIGEDWTRDPQELLRLESVAEDTGFQAEWRRVKNENKIRLARIAEEFSVSPVNPDTLFDIQAKRIHEYKRQLLTLLGAITLYLRLRDDPGSDVVPRTVLFSGKAAPGYFMAKLIIKLIHAVGCVIAGDPAVRGRLKVVFLPNFNVAAAQRIYPAAELSEQVSTAGMEASGTGNMKFALNGALTVGTADGANIEIRDRVGAENFFLFGWNVDQIQAARAEGYRPRRLYDEDPGLKRAIDAIASDMFSREEPGLFRPVVDSLLGHDPFMVLADYGDYVACQDSIGRIYRDRQRWTRMSILNVARMGWFSSDRAIREYCAGVWNVEPVPPVSSRTGC